jgi:hypothetical protein
VRHVRMIGLCLVAVVAMLAVGATSALAFPPKNELSARYFKNCPTSAEPEVEPGVFKKVSLCFYASTEGGEEGGSYTVGGITVPLSKKVALQFGSAVNEETGEETFAPAANGQPSLVPGKELVPGEPLSSISAAEQEELGWPQEMKESYARAVKFHETRKAYEEIEFAGPAGISRSNLLNEEGTAVLAPVKIKAENAWLSQLGDSCYIGSEEEPIVQHLTTGISTSPLTGEELHGAVGEIVGFFHAFNLVIIKHSNLVDNTYPVPGADCTGPNSGIVEATIDKIFSIPAVAGASKTELKGTLWNSTAEWVEHPHEKRFRE